MSCDVVEEDTITMHINKQHICTFWLVNKTRRSCSCWTQYWQLQLVCRHSPHASHPPLRTVAELSFDIYQRAEVCDTCNIGSPWVSKELRPSVNKTGNCYDSNLWQGCWDAGITLRGVCSTWNWMLIPFVAGARSQTKPLGDWKSARWLSTDYRELYPRR
jgi:hypothetical protein